MTPSGVIEGMDKPTYHGHCADLPFKKGDKVSVRKGTKFRSSLKKGEQVAGRTYTVTVFSVDNGCDAYTDFRGDLVPARDPVIEWVGAGGAWHTAKLNDILYPEGT